MSAAVLLLCMAQLSVGCKSRKVAADAPKQDELAQRPATDQDKEHAYGFFYHNGCSERMKGNLQQALTIFEECERVLPGRAATAYELGTIYRLLGNNAKALEYARRCAASNPKNEWYQLLLIDCCNAMGQHKQALKLREDLVRNFQGRLDFKEELAYEYAMQRQYDKALKIYEQIEQNYGVSEPTTQSKVKLLKSQGRIADAEKELLKLAATNKNELRYQYYLAEFYAERGDREKAKPVYDRILAIDPANAQVNLALFDYYNSQGKEMEAYACLKKFMENPQADPLVKTNLLATYYKSAEEGNKKMFERGFELSGLMLKAHPKTAEANGIYADFLRLNKQTKEAAAYYFLAALGEKRNYKVWLSLLYLENEIAANDSLERHSNFCMELFPSLPDAYLLNGLANSRLRNYSKAAQSLKDGLEFVNSRSGLRLDFLKALGDACHYNKNFAGSDKAFDEALKIEPDNTYVLNNYAYFLTLRNENLEKAEKYARRANELQPGVASYMDTLGWALYCNKKYAEAEPWLKKAAAGTPADATLQEHYGDVLYRLGKTQEALDQWLAAKKAGGNSAALTNKINDKKLND